MSYRPALIIGDAARVQLGAGFGMLADTLEVTLGPFGRLVAVARDARRNAPEMIDDGATLARRVFGVRDRFHSMGLLLARNLAWNVEETCGDGGTTAVVMARAMISKGCQTIAAGHDPMQLRRDIDKLVPAVIASLRAQARPVDHKHDILALAASITGSDELAHQIHDCFDVVGTHGAIEVRPSHGLSHDREYIQGALWNKGWESAQFVTQHGEAILERPFVLFTTYRLERATQLMDAMRLVAETDARRGLVVIAFSIEGEALNLLVTNKARGIMPTLALAAPGAGPERLDILQDLAVQCGGRLIAEESGESLEHLALADLGQADEIRAVRSAFTIIGGRGRPAAIRARVAEIRKQGQAQHGTGYVQSLFGERASKLLGGVALLRVGGATTSEREHNMARAEDAVRIVRAAVSSGVVPGGGAALARAALELPPAPAGGTGQAALGIVRAGLLQPMRAIARNSGFDGDHVVAQLAAQPAGHGFDVRAGAWADMRDARIVDPLHVVITAFQAAASTAAMALTTQALIHKPRSTGDDAVDLNP